MRHRRMAVLTVGLAATAMAGACVDTGIDPDGPPIKTDLSMSFCPGRTPLWFAVQNEGELWQDVSIANGAVTFKATPKVSIAFVVQAGSNVFTTYVFKATSVDLNGSTALPCDVKTGTKQVSGSISGLTGEEIARVSAAGHNTSVDATTASWSLGNMPDANVDVVATRYANAATEPANRVVIRRGVVPAAGSTPIAALAFSGAESSLLTSSTATILGAESDYLEVQSDLITANGTVHNLGRLTAVDDPELVGFVSVPFPLAIGTDFHLLSASATSVTGVRVAYHFYKTPGNRTLTLGPQVNPAVVNSASTTPYLRLRATVDAQSAYPSAMGVDLRQQNQGVFRSVSMITTSGFLGLTPSAWELTMPDFTGTSYQSTWALQNGVSYGWTAQGFNGPASFLFGGAATDGLTATRGIRSSTGN